MKLQKNGGHLLLSLFIALVFALTMNPTKAQAQIIDQLDANVPFEFHAGNAKFPAGQYIIRFAHEDDRSYMEISSADGRTSALFQVRPIEANSTAAKSELIFNKYGDRYFLAQLFEGGSETGNEVMESRYEKQVNKAALEAQEHVPAHRHGQQGS
jgi:hypothetical protein